MALYVCAFRGRRDSYQVPLALAESQQLDEFITDAYATPWLQIAAKLGSPSVQATVNFRFEPGISPGRVRSLWGTTALEHVRHKLGYSRLLTYTKLDSQFSWAAARRADQTRSSLFLYSSYAWEAFTARYLHDPRKVLFQYHPHPEFETRIIAADSAKYPDIGESFAGISRGELPEQLARRERDCWKYADLILCASTFTKQSLIAAGVDPTKCRVIPYGIEVPDKVADELPSEGFHAVFVGSGAQRKGLHHLLLAWQRASLPASSKLSLICRVIDRGIEQLAATVPGVALRPGIPSAELKKTLASSTLFVMPSLVEGFGQVYLEALAQGCPILGTPNTCLPDLGTEKDGIFMVLPGAIDELAAKLRVLSDNLQNNLAIREASRACATRFSWRRFRRSICESLVA